MTMQERGKDEPNAPPINSDRADELAADFTPSWASGEDDGGDEKTAIDAVSDKSVLPDVAAAADKTEVMAAITDQPRVDALPEPKPIEPQPVILAKNKTLIGSAIAPVTPPPPQVIEQPAPELAPELAAQIKREAIEPEAFESPGSALSVPAPKSFAPVAEAKDPFAAVPSTAKSKSIRPAVISDSDLAPKKSNKGLIFAIVGLGIAGGLGIFLKFALSEDPPKPKEPTEQASTPPVTPPNNDVPPPTVAAEPTPPPATTTKATAQPAADPAPVAAPPAKKDPPAVVAPTQPRHHNNPPAVVAAPPPVKETPKEQPKPAPKPGGGIVHENPF